jgi:hypothetical protein
VCAIQFVLRLTSLALLANASGVVVQSKARVAKTFVRENLKKLHSGNKDAILSH